MKGADKQSGAVLLTTLLVMSLMAALAVAMIDDIRFSVKRAVHVQAYAQIDWYQRGADDFARTYIAEQLGNLDGAQQNYLLLEAEPAILPIEGGVITLRIMDGSQCVSLGALGEAPVRRQFRQLLTLLGWPDPGAANLTSVAIDWQDKDNTVLPNGAEDYPYLGRPSGHRTANTAFTDISELRALEGMNEEMFQSLRPFVCARPPDQTSRININGLVIEQAPILASVLGGDNALAMAADLIAARPDGGYADQAALSSAPIFTGEDTRYIDFDMITYQPEHVWVEAEIIYRDARRVAAFEYALSGGKPVRTYKGQGDDIIRPDFRAKISGDAR